MGGAVRRALLVAFHFPPLAGSSGVQRTLRFAQHLPALGWQPLVLTASPMAYERSSPDLAAELPADLVVERAFALDSARHLAFRGRYVLASARPDRWVSWRFDAVRRGLRMIERYRPELIWSTYPIATAHVIGATLQRRSGLPWVADFRDPMAQDGYPPDPQTWADYERIERQALMQARASTFTTPGAAALYRRRYPQFADRIEVLENGYDEPSFAAVESEGLVPQPLNPGRLTLLHSGIVYPSERDPSHLFQALQQLARAGVVTPDRLRVRFRAAVHDGPLLQIAQRHEVAGFIECCPPIGYRAALKEMMQADGLLVLQASNCNEQIPAKLYEYLRAQRPVLALTDPTGDTAGVLQRAGLHTIAPLDDAMRIAALLQAFIDGRLVEQVPGAAAVAAASRRGRSGELGRLFDRLAAGPGRA
jgi:hypothetical protein